MVIADNFFSDLLQELDLQDHLRDLERYDHEVIQNSHCYTAVENKVNALNYWIFVLFLR